MAAALQDINRAIELRPAEPLAYVLRAQIRLSRNDPEYALRDIQKAQELGADAQIVAQIREKLR